MQRPEIVKQIKEKMMITEPTATTILYGSEVSLLSKESVSVYQTI